MNYMQNKLHHSRLLIVGLLSVLLAVMLPILINNYFSPEPTLLPMIPSLHFEKNQGQTADEVRYLSRNNGYEIYFTPTDIVYHFQHENQNDILRMQFIGATTSPQVIGENKLLSKSNYLIGNNPKQWHTNINHYARVTYKHLYKGINATFYGNAKQLEYDLHVAPYADPQLIRLHFAGARSLYINHRGALMIRMASNTIMMHKPVIYQMISGHKKMVAGQFKLYDDQVGFHIEKYNKAYPLIIDPVLYYSTYLGGTKGADWGYAIANQSDNAYIVGSANSLDFPVKNAYQATNKGKQRTIVITKMSTSGSSLIYSTYLGGSGNMNQGFGIAVDKNGYAYITGYTNSKDFPIKNAYQATNHSPNLTAFVTKLNASGNALSYSTYLGGSGGNDVGHAIAIDSSGNAYITGATKSRDFPIHNALQSINKGTNFTAFVTKLNSSGNNLIYSTYFGGSGGNDRAHGIAVDGSCNVYIAGRTNSKDFPTKNAYQDRPKPIGEGITAFVSKLNSSGSALIYSTYLGGSQGNDQAMAIAIDDGYAYVTGLTNATDFPLRNAYQNTNRGNITGFVTKLSQSGSSLIYSTYLGGSGGDDEGLDIAVSSGNYAYVVGKTNSTDFPTYNALQNHNLGPATTGFVTKFSQSGSNVIYSTYLGGSGGDDRVSSVSICSSDGNAYLTGRTNSFNFPVQNPYQATNNELGAHYSAFVSKINS